MKTLDTFLAHFDAQSLRDEFAAKWNVAGSVNVASVANDHFQLETGNTSTLAHFSRAARTAKTASLVKSVLNGDRDF